MGNYKVEVTKKMTITTMQGSVNWNVKIAHNTTSVKQADILKLDAKNT
jgi:hypothetical protein